MDRPYVLRDTDFDRVRNTIIGITVLSFAAGEKKREEFAEYISIWERRPAGDLIKDALRFVSKVE